MSEPLALGKEIMPGIISAHKQDGTRVIIIEDKRNEPMSACGDSAQNVACDETCPDCIYKPKPEPMSAMELITDEEFDELYNEILFIFNKNWITGEHKRIKELVSELIAQSRAADAKTIKELRDKIKDLENDIAIMNIV